MSRKLCVFTYGAILLLSALLDDMQATGTAWAQPTRGCQGGRQFMAGGEAFRDCPSCPEMVVLPAGIFTMGPDKHWDMNVLSSSGVNTTPLYEGKRGRYERR